MAHLIRIAARLSLLGKFSIVGLVATVVVASAMALIVTRGLTNLETEHAAEDAIFHVDSVVAPLMQKQRFDRPLSEELQARLARDLEARLPNDIFRVKIWRNDGMLIFSDDPSLVGQVFPDGERERAVAGETVAHVAEMGREAENVTEAAAVRALEVYTPIRSETTGEVLGVYEIYKTTDALDLQIAELRGRVWAGSLVGFLALYASLFLLVRRASRQLTAQNAMIRRRLRETLLLNRIILAASTEDSPDDVMETVCRELEEVCGLECSLVEGGDEAHGSFDHGHPPNGHVVAPMNAGGRTVGSLLLKARGSEPIDEQTRGIIDGVAAATGVALHKAVLLSDLERSNTELRRAYDATIEGLARALDKRDEETEGHSRRVTELTTRLLLAMGLAEEDVEHGRRGALLHDIGKLGIPDAILLKPGRLDDQERAVMMTHAALAYEMLAPIEHLRPALDIPHYHHEKWDGTGYPVGLRGEAIPLVARAFALVDVWDALSSDRPYRTAWPQDRVIEHLLDSAGTHFDPRILPLFLEVVGEYVGVEGLPTESRRSDRRTGHTVP